MRRVCVGRNGEDYVPRRLFLRAPAIGHACPFPVREPLAASVWEKVWKKEDQSGLAGVGFKLGLWLCD